jgi:hypothetical protein
MTFLKATLYIYGFLFALSFITWAFQDKLDLGEEEIQEDEVENIEKEGRWN